MIDEIDRQAVEPVKTGESSFLTSCMPVAFKLMRMKDRHARRQALSGWLMETSVLWAVFPLLDRLVEEKPLNFRIIALSTAISLAALLGGIILRKGDPA